MNIEKALIQLGLEPKEARLYLASLELGKAGASAIANKAKLQRTYFYDLSKRLVEIGLLQQIKEGRKKLYIATNPEKLVALQKERLSELQAALPELKAIYNTTGQKPKVYYYEDWDGIEQINKDTLAYKGEVVAFTTPRFFLAGNKKLSKDHIKKRLAIKQRIRLIGEVSESLEQLKEKDWKELRETRLLSKEHFSSNVEIGIYGNKVFIVDYKARFGLTIEGTEIAKTLKQIFSIVWSSSGGQ